MGRKYLLEQTPEGHHPANIIGLKTLCHWGLKLFAEPHFGFEFVDTFDYLNT
jgi:hypothetical protein